MKDATLTAVHRTLRSAVHSLILAFSLQSASAQKHDSDCWLWNQSGIPPQALIGTNPTETDLDNEIRRLSNLYDVPVEIVAAVGYRESSLLQYSPVDNFVIHNLCECRYTYTGVIPPRCSLTTTKQKPPGLGLFQFTGTTAGLASGWNRFVSDWMFNLESGVKLLSTKYEYALAKDAEPLKSQERSNRRVLENWIYALEFYHGWVPDDTSYSDPNSTSYAELIMNLIANPPTRLTALFAPVSITRPESVIMGFQWQNQYVALPDGTWQDKAGNTFAGSVHSTGGNAPPVAPIISAQPQNQIAPLGGTATFNVVALGTAPLSFQWRHNGIAVGQDSSTLTLNAVASTDSGTYTVTVSNQAATTASDLCTLSVNTANALRIVDGVRILEPPPYFIGDTSETIDATIRNVSSLPVLLDRIQANGDFIDQNGNLLNTITWNAANFSPALSLAPGDSISYVKNNSASPFPFLPAVATVRLYVKFNAIPGLREVTDAQTGSSAVLTFAALDKYVLNLDQVINGTSAKTPNVTYHGAGTSVVITATPQIGLAFAGWRFPNGTIFSYENPATVIVTRNMGLRPIFEPLVPRIRLRANGGMAYLSWPDWGTAFRLEFSNTPLDQSSWRTAGTTPELIGEIWETTAPLGEKSGIFRLKTP